MSTDTARTATAVTVTIARDPALVRTVRLVTASVTRRAGRDEEFVEEVRLAVGEACALLLVDPDQPGERSPAASDGAPVTVAITFGDQLRVDVTTSGPVKLVDDADSDIDGIEPWALLRGLVEDFRLTQDSGTTTVSLSWPMP